MAWGRSSTSNVKVLTGIQGHSAGCQHPWPHRDTLHARNRPGSIPSHSRAPSGKRVWPLPAGSLPAFSISWKQPASLEVFISQGAVKREEPGVNQSLESAQEQLWLEVTHRLLRGDRAALGSGKMGHVEGWGFVQRVAPWQHEKQDLNFSGAG